MEPRPLPVSVTFCGKTHRGYYYVRAGRLVLEAAGLGTQSADASVLEGGLGEAAENMAKLLLMELVRQSATDEGRLAAGNTSESTTRISYLS